jgi:hypothetical protein
MWKSITLGKQSYNGNLSKSYNNTGRIYSYIFPVVAKTPVTRQSQCVGKIPLSVNLW